MSVRIENQEYSTLENSNNLTQSYIWGDLHSTLFLSRNLSPMYFQLVPIS